MRIKILIVLVFLLTVLSNGLLYSNSYPQVLLLHSYHQGLDWTDAITVGVSSVIKGNSDAELVVEYLDTKRFGGSDYWKSLTKLFRTKLAKRSPSLVIAADNNALQFVMQNRTTLFRGVPVVFCGINNFSDIEAAVLQDKLMTGVAERVDLSKNINFILRFHPKLKKIYVVLDDMTTTGKIYGSRIKQLKKQSKTLFDRDLSLITASQPTLDQLLKQLKQIDKKSAILLTAYNRDENDRYYSYNQIVRKICKNVEVPVYGIWRFMLGKGVVGGKMVSGKNQGVLAAQYAVRILRGEQPYLLPVITGDTGSYCVDYQQLKKHNIQLAKLPGNTLVINKTRNFYENYRTFIWLILITLLLLLIMYLTLSNKRRKALDVYYESETRYRHLADAAFEAIILHRDKEILDVNKQFEQLTGFSRKELLGSSIEMLISPEELERVLFYINQEWEDKFETVLVSCNGVRINSEVRARHFNYRGSRVRVAVIRDITDRLERENRLQKVLIDLEKSNQELLDSRESLRRINNTKDMFFSIVARDLLDPQHSLVLGTQMLRNRMISRDEFHMESDLADRLYKSSLSVYRLVQNLLDWSKLQMEQLKLRIEEVNIPALMDETATIYSELILEKQLRLVVDAPAKLLLHTDKNALSVVLRNLVHNSVKFTEEGGTVTLKATDNGEGILLSVADNGIGMDQSVVTEISEAVLLTDDQRTGPDNPMHGIGLGLTVCRELVKLLRGGFTITSSPGQGTETLIVLPDIISESSEVKD